MAVVDERALYGVPRDRFVAERNALARALRADGHRDDAQRVGKLGKPTVAVWTVNQLARREPDAIDELFTAGEQLADAQARRERERLEGLRIAEPAARRRSDRAAGDLRLAEEARDRAEAALDDADRALTVARDDARAAAEHHRSLQRDLEQSATGVPPSDPPGNTDDESQ